LEIALVGADHKPLVVGRPGPSPLVIDPDKSSISRSDILGKLALCAGHDSLSVYQKHFVIGLNGKDLFLRL
jgi:hypothetical protein